MGPSHAGAIAMQCYLVCCEVQGDGDCVSLYESIRTCGRVTRVTLSTWAVLTNRTTDQIRNAISRHLGRDDRIFVVKSGVEASWMNVRCESQWLRKHL